MVTLNSTSFSVTNKCERSLVFEHNKIKIAIQKDPILPAGSKKSSQWIRQGGFFVFFFAIEAENVHTLILSRGLGLSFFFLFFF